MPGIGVLVALVACGELLAPGGSLDRQWGRPTANNVVDEFAWTPDSRRIVYVSNGKDSRAYTEGAEEHSSRAVTDAVPGANGTNRSAQVRSHPEVFYFSVVQDRWCMPASIYESFARGPLDTVATDVVNGWFVASPTGSRVAFTAVAYPAGQEAWPDCRDSLVVLDVLGSTRGRRRAVERGIGWSDALPLALGDDGSLVFLGTDRRDPHNVRSVVRRPTWRESWRSRAHPT